MPIDLKTSDTSTKRSRHCPVCQSSESKFLFRQEFSAFSEGGLLTGYDLVVCQPCGFAYANGIPSRKCFDHYYSEMSKYEQAQRDGELSKIDKLRFSQIADLLAPNIRNSASILDIGCATAGLLAELKRRGFSKLLGLDPSKNCAAVARSLYGIEVKTLTINDLPNTKDTFDVVILIGVLEHLPELDSALQAVKGVLKEGSLIYVEVPDASRYQAWFSAPYQFISIEHVNYFSPRSLRNFFARQGFDGVLTERVVRYLGNESVEPAVAGLFEYNGSVHAQRRDNETGPALLEYLESSRLLEMSIHERISELVASQVPVAIWGTGTHTLRLLETSRLPEVNIVAFLDSNTRYHGKRIQGREVMPPAAFSNPLATILISSQVAESEIIAQIRDSLHWGNRIVCFYGSKT